MGSVLMAVEVAGALADAIQHMLTMQQSVHGMIASAKDGELSEEQIQQLESMRHQAVAVLDKAVADKAVANE